MDEVQHIKEVKRPQAPSVSCADSSLPEGASSYTFRPKICDADMLKMLEVSASLREGGGTAKP